jgi:hypothetical protein
MTETAMFNFKRFNDFARDDSGAITVDWVVLTAGVVALGGLAVAAITGNMGNVGAKVNSHLSSATISTTF